METSLLGNQDSAVAEVDLDFDKSLEHVHHYFKSISGNQTYFFLTDISGDNVWSLYQESLRRHGGEAAAQHLNCHACREVVKKLGNVVTIGDDGSRVPVMWAPYPEINSSILAQVYTDLWTTVSQRKVVSSWMSDVHRIGVQTTVSKSGHEWTHFYFDLPSHVVVRSGSYDKAHQIMAKSKERFKTLMSEDTGIHAIKLDVIGTVIRLLSEDELYRSDNFLAPAKFHYKIKEALVTKEFNSATLWRDMASSPPGWANVNSTMIGQLYGRIQDGNPLESIKHWWNRAMDPSRFQRAQSEPTKGELETAERIIAAMGAERSLERRYARLEEVRLTWLPKPEVSVPNTGGVFSSIKAKGTSFSLTEQYQTQPKAIDWEKFVAMVLPTADKLELKIPDQGGFAALATATHADAPPIMQWDTLEDRYPISSYTYVKPAPAQHWNMVPGTYVKVTGITKLPGHTSVDLLVLAGCKDSNSAASLCLFNEILKPEFHEIRKVMEAYSNKGVMTGSEESNACGWMLSSNTCGIFIRVTTGKEVREYLIDRMD